MKPTRALSFLHPISSGWLAVTALIAVASAAETPSSGPYREPFAESFPIRREQHLQIKAYADRLLQEQTARALASVQPDYSSAEAYQRSIQPHRDRLQAVLGTPPPGAKAGRVTKFQQVGEDAEAVVFRVWIEVVEGVEAYGIYLLPKQRNAKAPLLIAQHGGGGNPEAIVDLDTRANYHSFGREAVRRGYIVWAPALAMRCGYCNDEPIPGAARELLDQKLKLAGTSIIGLELHKIIESTRTLIQVRPEIDPERIGMTGLSWGGYFTMYATALAPFIKVAAPSGYFRDQEQQMKRAAADDSRLADREFFGGLGHAQAIALICPRPCYVEIGMKDGALNNLDGARIEAERAAQYYRKLGVADRFQFNLHPAGHEFDTPAILAFFDRHL
ncbi:MAG: dienelactone hydrolase family protein [Opitutaceae bacterium]|nr:dienelactone hydrolase family protein [Opitutaceae bacterium]